MVAEEVSTKYFTLEEIAINNGRDTKKVWIIIRDVVYDVTEYLEEHPGGGELITEWAGKDATKAFDDFGHSGDAKKDLKRYKIGEVVEEQRKKKQKKNEKESKAATNGGPKIITEKEQVINRSCIQIITCGLLV